MCGRPFLFLLTPYCTGTLMRLWRNKPTVSFTSFIHSSTSGFIYASTPFRMVSIAFVKTSLLRDTQGKTVRYMWIAQDTRERKQEEEHFFYYAHVAQNHMDAVITTDNSYNILSWNEAAERLYGWKKEEVLGKFVDDILFTEYFTNTSG